MSRTWEGPNDEAIEAWNTVLFEKFMRFRHLVTTGLGIHGDVALARHPPAEGQRVLDIGCGFGDTTRELARRVGPRGEAVGVDAAERFIRQARAEATQGGCDNARFAIGDVQSCALGGPYGHAFSRFGTMFFRSPVGALANVRRSLEPGAALCMVVWRKREDNAFIHAAQTVVDALLPPPEPHDEPTCGPGPFSMASADVVTDVLRAAGWELIALERHDAPICIGKDLEEAVQFALELGPAGERVRLAGAEGERVRPRLATALRDALGQYQGPDGVCAESSVWIVSARVPA